MPNDLGGEFPQQHAAPGAVGGAPAGAAAAPWAPSWISSLMSDTSRERLGKFLLTAGQLALILVAMHVFRLEESSGLLKLTGLIFGGFVLHAGLPIRYRPPFFLFFSLAGFAVVLGASVVLLVAIGLVLVGICHLPIAFRWRIALILTVVGVLAAFRANWLPWAWTQSPWIARVLPVVGSMIMFRLIIYLYDLRHETPRAAASGSVWQRLSYFFLPLNGAFLLFPIIDYRTYRSTYYDTDALEIYQRGTLRILRGVTHLLLYRVAYYYLSPSPDALTGLGSVVLYVMSAWLLYLRVSGVFHIVVGVLGLFGHNLPEVMRLYFLASSPNDLWRRANIYWKDFMMKVFYYPVFKPLQRKVGLTTALVLATTGVFIATWFFHSYQWFWVLGTFPVSGLDAVFWTIFAVLVLANSLWELKRGRRRTLGRPSAWSFGEALGHSARVLAMFVFMAGMWSWWSSRDTGQWISVLSNGSAGSGPAAYLVLGAAVAGVLMVGVLLQYAASRGWTAAFAVSSGPFLYRRSAMVTSLGALALVGAGLPTVQRQVQQQIGATPANFIASLQSERLNAQDAEIQLRGYYESLLKTDVATWQQQLSARQEEPAPGQVRPADWKSLHLTDGVRFTGDGLRYELKPSYEFTFKGQQLRTNEWGFRDEPYTLEKPPGTKRIVLLGGSITMGAGVRGEQTYEALVEDELNKRHAGRTSSRYEILNFAVGGYGLVQEVLVTQRKVFRFQPDIVLVAANSGEISRSVTGIAEVVKEGGEFPPYLQELIQRLEITQDMKPGEIRRRLKADSVFRELQLWGYREIAEESRRRGALPVWAWVPIFEGVYEPETFEYSSALAREAGFIVLDLSDAYEGYDTATLWVVPWDSHPSVKGHQLLADALYKALVRHEDQLRLGLTSAGGLR